jgi:hypothetical protein
LAFSCFHDSPFSYDHGGDHMPEYLQSMPTKHTWTFKPRLRAKAFGWKGSHLACQRLKEAVTEIKKADRADPVAAGDGVVTLMERIWPAFQDIDTSSGALGGAVYWAQNELLPIAIEAPADRKTRTSGWTGSGRRSRMMASTTFPWSKTGGASCAVPVKSPLTGRIDSSVWFELPGPTRDPGTTCGEAPSASPAC